MRTGGFGIVPRDAAAGGGTVVINNFGGSEMELTSKQFGLGTGTADATALQNFLSALTGSYTEDGLDRSSVGIHGKISAGTWIGSEFGHVILAPAGTGDQIISGEGTGVTTLKAADRGGVLGCMNSAQNIASASRLGNTFTLQLGPTSGSWFAAAPTFGSAPSSSAPLCQPWDIIIFKVLCEGALKWAAYTVTDNNVGGDYTKIRYNAFGSGMATDGCVPPSAQAAYFIPGFFFHPLNYSSTHHLRLRDLTLLSGSKTGTPLDGMALRRAARMEIEKNVTFDGWFCAEVINGSMMPNLLGYGSQNTDHNDSHASYRNCTFNAAFITNSQSGSNVTDSVGGSTRSGVGGGRDNHFRFADMSTPGDSHFLVADDGWMATCDLDGLNTKSGQAVFRGSGVAGVPACEDTMIDCIAGFFKVESPANHVFDDPSLTRAIWGFQKYHMRFEAGLAINGGGNNIDFSEKPYHLTNVTIISGVFTGTLTESGHGLTVGTPIQVGGNGPTATLASSMDGQFFGPVIPSSIVVNENLVALGFPTKGTVRIASSTGFQAVAYTGISGTNTFTGCSGGQSRAQMHTNGAVQSLALYHSAAIQTIADTTGGSGISATVVGKTISFPVPWYTDSSNALLPDISVAQTCQLGRLAFMRAGKFSRADGQYDFDLGGDDRYVQGGMFLDLQSAGPLTMHLTQDDVAPASRRKLPRFRIADFEGFGGTRGTYSNTSGVFKFTCGEGEGRFNSANIGDAITVGSANGVIAAFVDIYTVILATDAFTPGSGLTWSLTFTAPGRADDPRIKIIRGTQEFELLHGCTTSDSILAGHLVEYQISADSAYSGRASQCASGEFLAGVAMQPCADQTGKPTVTTNGVLGGTAQVIPVLNSYLVMCERGRFVGSDDVKFVSGSSSIPRGSTLIDNGAAHPGEVAAMAGTSTSPTPGQRLVGKGLKTASGGAVGGVYAGERWV